MRKVGGGIVGGIKLPQPSLWTKGQINTLAKRIAQLEKLLGHVNLPCKKLHGDAVLPAKAGNLEAGWDMCCVADETFYTVVDDSLMWCKGDELKVKHNAYMNPYTVGDKYKGFGGPDGTLKALGFVPGDKIRFLWAGDSHLFHTGLACAIDPGYSMLLWDRSGMGGKKDIHRLAGVIDCTYRGEWLVKLVNLSKNLHIIKAGDKIVQGIITRVIPGKTYWVDDLPESSRGEAGFGSTGR